MKKKSIKIFYASLSKPNQRATQKFHWMWVTTKHVWRFFYISVFTKNLNWEITWIQSWLWWNKKMIRTHVSSKHVENRRKFHFFFWDLSWPKTTMNEPKSFKKGITSIIRIKRSIRFFSWKFERNILRSSQIEDK